MLTHLGVTCMFRAALRCPEPLFARSFQQMTNRTQLALTLASSVVLAFGMACGGGDGGGQVNLNNNNKENGFSVRCLKDSNINYCCSFL